MELTALIGRIDLLPEQLEQLPVRKQSGIERNLYSLVVPGSVRADLFICWIWSMTAGIAGDDPVNARQLLERCDHAPETTAGKSSQFFIGRWCCIHRYPSVSLV
ncbi:hypothetical protein D3C77_580260 [compost metagenome]